MHTVTIFTWKAMNNTSPLLTFAEWPSLFNLLILLVHFRPELKSAFHQIPHTFNFTTTLFIFPLLSKQMLVFLFSIQLPSAEYQILTTIFKSCGWNSNYLFSTITFMLLIVHPSVMISYLQKENNCLLQTLHFISLSWKISVLTTGNG